MSKKPGTLNDFCYSVAFNPRASQPERYDAMAELQSTYAPKSLASLMPPEPVMRIIKAMQNAVAEEEMNKAAGRGNIIPWPGDTSRLKRGGMQSVYLDDLQVNVMGNFFEKPGTIQFEAMRAMVEQTPILNGIVMTRLRQIARYAQPQESDDGPGFVIKHVDKDHKLDDTETELTKKLTQFVRNCGWETKPRKRRAMKRDSFAQFLQKHVRDSLTMDSAPIETEFKRDRSRGMDGFYAVDGSTIRLCTERGYEGDDSIFALQVVQGNVRTAFTLDDLIYEPRNPRADVRIGGYGLSETELLIRVVTGFLNAMTMNIKGFSDNAIPKGFLTVIGDYTDEDLDAFKRYWNAMVRGVNNQWSLPVMSAKDKDSAMKYERIETGFDEMYFSKWMTFLTSLACAIYGIAPDEINFESFATSKSSLSGDDTEEKIASSKDKGLHPLLSYVENELSDFVISDFAEQFCLRFVGLEGEDKKARDEKRKLILSLDEMRAEEGYKPWQDKPNGGMGSAPINSSLLSMWQQQQQQAAQQAGGPGTVGPDGKTQLDFGNPDSDDDSGDTKSAGGKPSMEKALPPAWRVGL